jgi:hypothetical protein
MNVKLWKREGLFMIQTLYDNHIIIYIYAGLCGLGLLFRLIVNLVYKHLVRESDKLGETKNKMLVHIKMKFETCFKLKIGVNNVDTFVDKHVLNYRFCGLLLSTWENLCGQVLILNLLLVPIIAVFSVFYKCGQEQILFSGAVGIAASAILILVDKSINIIGKKKLLRLNLLDYLDNFCKVRLLQEEVHPELTSQLRKELIQSADAGKQISATLACDSDKVVVNDEISRRKEAKLKKEEERRLLAKKKEEELKKAEEARREAEHKKQEEKKRAAARRREEERLKIEEERKALEQRRDELKRKAMEKQQGLELRKQHVIEKEQILQSLEEELKPSESESDMDMLMKGLEEIAAEKEKNARENQEKDEQDNNKPGNSVAESAAPQKTAEKSKTRTMSRQEEKLIEDVLKEFFA